MAKVTIIMPVYNSEQYLSQAVNSILSQTMKDFELLLIDDGSKDSSGYICDTFSQKDMRVRVFHKKNGGICSARNIGLENANGEYIAFCDNDDLYEPDLLKDNLAYAMQENADIVRFKRCQRMILLDGSYEDHISPNFSKLIIKSEDIGKYYKDIRFSGNGVWTALYKRTFLEKHKIRFDESMKYGAEDLYFNLTVLSKGPIIALNPEIYYNWIKREQHSTSAKYNENWLESIKRCLKLEYLIMDQCHVNDYYPGFCKSWLSSTYIYEYIRYVNRRQCPLHFFQRISKIKELRNMPEFNSKAGKKDYQALKKISQKDYILYKLFDLKMYFLLYYLIGRRK